MVVSRGLFVFGVWSSNAIVWKEATVYVWIGGLMAVSVSNGIEFESVKIYLKCFRWTVSAYYSKVFQIHDNTSIVKCFK
jgi:hypothetical protein